MSSSLQSNTRYRVDDSPCPGQTKHMGRPKKYDERIQLPLVDGATARIDALLGEGEYRLDFIRAAIETEIQKRTKGATPVVPKSTDP